LLVSYRKETKMEPFGSIEVVIITIGAGLLGVGIGIGIQSFIHNLLFPIIDSLKTWFSRKEIKNGI